MDLLLLGFAINRWAGNLLEGTLLDHFGWLGADPRPLDGTRLIGLAPCLNG